MKNSKQNKLLNKRSGFTLIEILLVVVIIGILASIAIPRLGGHTEKAKLSAAKQTIGTISGALQIYEMNNGEYPSSLEGLLDSSKDGFPFLQRPVVPKDPWDTPFTYSAPGSHNTYDYDISCTSPKGVEVNNWE